MRTTTTTLTCDLCGQDADTGSFVVHVSLFNEGVKYEEEFDVCAECMRTKMPEQLMQLRGPGDGVGPLGKWVRQ